MSTTKTHESAPFAAYRSAPGHYDECFAADGKPRKAFVPLVNHITGMGRESLETLVTEGAALARESGITYNALEDEGELPRPWELAFTPLAIPVEDWRQLETGLRQRTRLLEAVLDDLLGPQRLLRERIFPPELILRNPEFLRPYHGLPRVGGARLHVVATDLARAPDGHWRVIGDRTRAPSGLGYLVENRIITSRAYPDLIHRSNVYRIASFFMRLRQMFETLSPRASANPRVAILTPGQKSYRYFEDTFLARYLGYTLVQGRDLAVRGGVLNLKTLGGLVPVDVLWRHISDDQCDPLELKPDAIEGVTGLVQAVRSGNVSIANGLGSKLAQSPALLPFFPAASRFLFGEELQLATVETHWCGQPDALRLVLEGLDRFVFRSAFAVRGDRLIRPTLMSAEARQEFIASLREQPYRFVAQELVDRSTTPVWRDGKMEPWFVALRSFQIQANGAVEVLPGGLVRVSPTTQGIENPHGSTQLGQDCWVMADEPVDQTSTLLPSPHVPLRFVRGGAELPSRVAENLFWLGRYSERAESIARVLRTTMVRLVGEQSVANLPEMPRLIAALAAIGQIEPDYAVKELRKALPSLDDALPESLDTIDQQRGLSPTVAALTDKAMAVRDRISLDAYRIVQQIGQELAAPVRIRGRADTRTAINRLTRLISGLLAFSGIGQESFTRTLGWRFLQLGRRIERAWQTAEVLRATLVETDERQVLEAVLEATDSIMTYRSRYLLRLEADATIDLLVTDETNPRSIRFQLERITEVLEPLPVEPDEVGVPYERRLAFDLLHRVRMAQPALLAKAESSGRRVAFDHLLEILTEGLPELSNAITARYLIHTLPSQALTGQL